MAYLTYSKDFRGVADVFLRDPGRYGPLLQFIDDVMTRPSELTRAERELIAAHVSKKNGCGFCLGAHRATLAAMEIGWATLEALDTNLDDAAISDKLRPVLHFASKLTDAPGRVTADDIGSLRAAGWSDQAIEDAINVTALFNYVNRLVDGFGIKGDDDYFRHVGTALATQGYAPLIRKTSQGASRPSQDIPA